MSQRPNSLTNLIERIPFHPFAFALFPILAVFATNQDNLVWPQVFRSIVLSELGTLLMLLLARVLLSGWDRAAIFTTLVLLLFFSYGHIYQLTEDWAIRGMQIGRHRYFLVAAVLLILVAFFTLRYRTIPRGWPTSVLNIVGAMALVLQLSGLNYAKPRRLHVVDPSKALPSEFPGKVSRSNLPDIYYIILDAYGRQDLLKQIYGFDNSEFTDWLTNRGFYVASNSHANYLSTTQSLSSSLNMQYITTLHSVYGFPLDDLPGTELIDENTVRRWLEDIGYQTVAFDTGYSRTTLPDADRFIRVGSASGSLWDRFLVPQPNRFEAILLDTTLFRAYLDYRLERGDARFFEHTYSEQRDRIHTIFSTLKQVPNWAGPHFVFAHVIAPHPPFVFGPNGDPLTPSYPYSLADHHDDFVKFGTRQDYATGYVGQAKYINKLVEDSVSTILANSDPQPIIIIQGDHGPGAFYTTDSLADTYLPDRASNLNAYLVPSSMKGDLYPSITPVNSFRLVFKDVLGTQLDLLPDETYFSQTDTVPVDPSIDLYPSPPKIK